MIYVISFFIAGLFLFFIDLKFINKEIGWINFKDVRPLKQEDNFNSNSINGCGLKLIEGVRSGIVDKKFIHTYYQFFCLFFIPIIPVDCVIGEKRFVKRNFESHRIYGMSRPEKC